MLLMSCRPCPCMPGIEVSALDIAGSSVVIKVSDCGWTCASSASGFAGCRAVTWGADGVLEQPARAMSEKSVKVMRRNIWPPGCVGETKLRWDQWLGMRAAPPASGTQRAIRAEVDLRSSYVFSAQPNLRSVGGPTGNG